MEIPNEQKNTMYKVLTILFVALTLQVLVGIFTPDQNNGVIGGPDNKVITLSGYGEVQAVPDIANVYFSINKEAKTVKEAQAMVAEIEKKAVDLLKNEGIEDKDIKTVNASFSPKYEYRYDTKISLPCTQYNCPPRPGNNVIVGYSATESMTVKVRNTDNVGKIMQGLGEIAVSELSGPDFSIDDEDTLKAEARKKAIEDAKAKAEVLAKDLGVRLGDIVNFSESGGYSVPIMYSKMEMSTDSISAGAPASLPKGENTISSDVTITYQIK